MIAMAKNGHYRLVFAAINSYLIQRLDPELSFVASGMVAEILN
jgi:hypothetical protein